MSGRDENPEEKYSQRSVALNSDIALQSPWSHKMLLSLDGGGVRGYSSLLILQELVSRIAALEKGKVPMSSLLTVPAINLTPVATSGAHPWNRSKPGAGTTKAAEHDHDATRQQTSDARTGDSGQTTESQPSQETLPNPKSEQQSRDQNDLTKFVIHHYFDYVAGTSTGGLSALMLSRMKMNIVDALKQYNVVGNEVFAHPRWTSVKGLNRPKYATENMKRALHKVLEKGLLGERSRTNVKTTRVVLKNENMSSCHTAIIAHGPNGKEGAERVTEGAYIFRSYNHPRPAESKNLPGHFNPGPPHNVELWKNVDGNDYVDGGVGTNNPALRAFMDIAQVHHGEEPALVLTIGTGIDRDPNASNRTDPDHETDQRKRHIFKHLRGMLDVKDTMTNIITDSEEIHQDLESFVTRIRTSKGPDEEYPMYFRFNVPGISDVKLDEWLPSADGSKPGQKTLDALENATNAYLGREDIKERLQECAIELVRIRRQRARTDRWERYATETIYQCPHDKCKTKLIFQTRKKLRRHAYECHEYATWASSGNERYCTIDECAYEPMLMDIPSSTDPRGLDRTPLHAQIDSRHAFLKHLTEHHGMINPQLHSREELEDWLDNGRIVESERKNSGLGPQEGGHEHQPVAKDSVGDMKDRKIQSWIERRARSKDNAAGGNNPSL